MARSLSATWRWPLAAGLCVFGCGAVAAGLLSAVLRVFAQVVGLPESFPLPLLAAPALLVGAAVWWTIVERGAAYTYPRGVAFGALTALVTGLCWTAWFLAVWSVDLLAAGAAPLLVALVFAVTAVAGALVGPPLISLRRRYAEG